ncbi:nuclear transport factor 2 family protein [Pseudonocardia sp. NPDC046786]|uniref:nuclear transport factor 2 family protein n=1 Tax=Pseudonocardia sp. NPDC046786 TaxID=3155471 RepID=UPI0033F11220
MDLDIPRPVADMIDAANRFDTDDFMAPFAPDAMVNDRHRQFWGVDAIRAWCEIEITGDHVTITPVDVIHHYGDVIVTAEVDGDYDKSDLPPVLVLQFYLSLRAGKIVQCMLLPVGGRKLSKATETSEAATPYADPVPTGLPG